MLELIKNLSATALTRGDGIIAVLVVAFVEYIIKDFICKKLFKKEPSEALMKISPIAVSAIVFVALSFIQKAIWYKALVHGIGIGFLAQLSYDKLLKLFIEAINKIVQTIKILITEGKEAAKKFWNNIDEKGREILTEEKNENKN